MNWRNRITALLALVALCYCLAPERVEAGVGKIQAVVNQMFGGSISAAGAADGQALVWQASTGSWVPGAAGGWVGTATSNLDMSGYQIVDSDDDVVDIGAGALLVNGDTGVIDFAGTGVTNSGAGSVDLSGGTLTDSDNTVNVSKSTVVTGSIYASGGALVASAAGLSNPAYIEQYAAGVLGITSDGAGGPVDGELRVATMVATVSSATSVYTLTNWWDASGLVAPAADFATLDTRGEFHVADFDDSAIESLYGRGSAPKLWAGATARVKVFWAATSAVAGDAVFMIRFADLGDQDLDSVTYDDWIPMVPVTCSGTSGICVTSTTGYQLAAALDGIAAGDPFQFELARNATHGGDDMVGDAEVLRVEVTWD